MNIIDSRPEPPSRQVVAAELGITLGAPGCRARIDAAWERAPSVISYRRALREYESRPEVVAERQRRAAEADARRQRTAASLAAYLAMPCRRRRDRMSPAAAAVATLAHLLGVRGGLEVRRSPRSETCYAWHGVLALRLSGHALGYSDFGTRQQVHGGPELILDGDDLAPPAEAIDKAIAAVREYGAELARGGDAMARQDAASMIRALRRCRASLRGVRRGATR